MLIENRNLLSGKSINGYEFCKSESDPDNWMRGSLSLINFRIVDLISHNNKHINLTTLAATLEVNLNNPIHYGDNTPGFTNSQGKPLVPAPSFTFWDLWQFGVTGEDGFEGFLRDCGLPKETTRISVIAAIGLLLVDCALAAMDEQRLSWAGHLMSQAQDCAEDAFLLVLSETKQSEIKSAIQEAMRARGIKAMEIRYAKDKDVTQAIKSWVKECWQEWKAKPERYKSASAFARAMLDKHPDHLTSEVVITRWVREWKKEKIAS